MTRKPRRIKISPEKREQTRLDMRKRQKLRDLKQAKEAGQPTLVKALKTELAHEFK